MKIINDILKRPLLLILAVLFFGSLSSCTDELPSAIDSSDKYTDLRSIRIVNAGENGDEVLVGEINENSKMITFPAMHPSTDFANLRLEAELSEGASLEQNVYDIVYPERVYTATRVLKIVNAPRTKEYFMTLEQIAPPDGANFVDFQVYNHSGANKYPAFVGGDVRSVGFDGEHVLVVPHGGVAGAFPHVLKMEDLRNGIISRTNLNTAGVSGGGIFNWMAGYMVNGNILLGNLTSGSELKLYHYQSPTATAQTILSIPVKDVPGSPGVARAGDLMSASLTDNGNGFVYFADNNTAVVNPLNRSFVRVSVSNFTSVTSPIWLTPAAGYGVIWKYFNRVGTSSSYLYTSHNHPIVVADANGATLYAMPANALTVRASDPKIIEFNNSRYLVFATAPVDQGSTVFIYDITAGDDVVEAIRTFSALEVKNPVFEYSLGTGANNGAPVAQIGYHIEKDEDGNDAKLSILGAAANNGFAVFEFNKKEVGD